MSGYTALNIDTEIIDENVIAETAYFLECKRGATRISSTSDAIFVVSQIVEKAIEYNRPAFMCFVDLKKTFDFFMHLL